MLEVFKYKISIFFVAVFVHSSRSNFSFAVVLGMKSFNLMDIIARLPRFVF